MWPGRPGIPEGDGSPKSAWLPVANFTGALQGVKVLPTWPFVGPASAARSTAVVAYPHHQEYGARPESAGAVPFPRPYVEAPEG